ncbi:MAG TPA: hypothetical protein VK841_16250, partial [Polyangiaceae bacterium]|nr:hypothetical protein [Polyangiaceae bacterium]
VACLADTDCSGMTPKCDTTRGADRCVQCIPAAGIGGMGGADAGASGCPTGMTCRANGTCM